MLRHHVGCPGSDKTQWFLVLHSDDVALENFIQRNVEILDRCGPKVAAVSSNYYEFGIGEDRLAHAPAEDRVVFRADSQADLMHTALIGSWCKWHISGSFINRKLWEKFRVESCVSSSRRLGLDLTMAEGWLRRRALADPLRRSTVRIPSALSRLSHVSQIPRSAGAHGSYSRLPDISTDKQEEHSPCGWDFALRRVCKFPGR